jgi:hypothetical protein
MRLAGRFSRRVRGYAKAHDIPVIDCVAGARKHDVADDYLAKTTVTEGLFLVLVGRAQAPVWHVGANYHLEKKTPYVNHETAGGNAHKNQREPLVHILVRIFLRWRSRAA